MTRERERFTEGRNCCQERRDGERVAQKKWNIYKERHQSPPEKGKKEAQDSRNRDRRSKQNDKKIPQERKRERAR